MNIYLRELKKALSTKDIDSAKKIVRDCYSPNQPSKEAEILNHLYDASSDYLKKYGEVMRYYNLIRRDNNSIKKMIEDLHDSFQYLNELMNIFHLHPHTIKSMHNLRKELEHLRDAIDVKDEFFQKKIIDHITHDILSEKLFRHELYDLVMSLIIFYNLIQQSLDARVKHDFDIRIKSAMNAFERVKKHIEDVLLTEDEINTLHNQLFNN
jgi:hypothetical protein